MAKEFNLTPGELKVAMILVKCCLDGMGGKRPSDLENDEFTWVDGKDLMSYGYTQHQAGGFFSSLSQKGFIDGYYPGRKVTAQCDTSVATSGWQYIDTIWDANLALLSEKGAA